MGVFSDKKERYSIGAYDSIINDLRWWIKILESTYE